MKNREKFGCPDNYAQFTWQQPINKPSPLHIGAHTLDHRVFSGGINASTKKTSQTNRL